MSILSDFKKCIKFILNVFITVTGIAIITSAFYFLVGCLFFAVCELHKPWAVYFHTIATASVYISLAMFCALIMYSIARKLFAEPPPSMCVGPIAHIDEPYVVLQGFINDRNVKSLVLTQDEQGFKYEIRLTF